MHTHSFEGKPFDLDAPETEPTETATDLDYTKEPTPEEIAKQSERDRLLEGALADGVLDTEEAVFPQVPAVSEIKVTEIPTPKTEPEPELKPEPHIEIKVPEKSIHAFQSKNKIVEHSRQQTAMMPIRPRTSPDTSVIDRSTPFRQPSAQAQKLQTSRVVPSQVRSSAGFQQKKVVNWKTLELSDEELEAEEKRLDKFRIPATGFRSTSASFEGYLADPTTTLADIKLNMDAREEARKDYAKYYIAEQDKKSERAFELRKQAQEQKNAYEKAKKRYDELSAINTKNAKATQSSKPGFFSKVTSGFKSLFGRKK